MKKIDKKSATELGKDLRMAKILVLKKHGFTNLEISLVMDCSERLVENLISTYEEQNK